MKNFIDLTSQLDKTTQHPASEKSSEPLPNRPAIRFIAWQGGGARGAGYLGGIKQLQKTKGHSMSSVLPEVKVVAGASAGAITAFLVGLGFSADQLSEIIDDMNFMDFYDSDLNSSYLNTAWNLLQKGGVYEGKSFHDWAGMWLQLIVGDPDITFGEFQEKCSQDPALKEMIFKATKIDIKENEQGEWTFDAYHSPNVVIRDALRASMSFPGAFTPWVIRVKNENQNFKPIGTFADGGILNNYPIGVFSRPEYKDTHYRFSISTHSNTGKRVESNPLALGFSLSNLSGCHSDITPFTPRIRALKQKESQTNSTKPNSATSHNQQTGWSWTQMATTLFNGLIGNVSIEDVEFKNKAYSNTIQIFDENVGVLEFSADKQKLDKLIKGAKKTTKLWLQEKNNPSVPFDGKYTLLTKKELRLKADDPKKFYIQQIARHHLEMRQEKRIRGASEINCSDNRRYQFHNYHLKRLIKELDEKQMFTTKEKGQIQIDGYTLAKQMDKHVQDNEKAIKDQYALRQRLFNSQLLVKELAAHLSKDPELVLTICKGKMSRFVDLLELGGERNPLLPLIFSIPDACYLEKFLMTMQKAVDAKQKNSPEDTDVSMDKFLNKTLPFSSYFYCLQSTNKDPNACLKRLKVLETFKADPLKKDTFKNDALDYLRQSQFNYLVDSVGWKPPKVQEVNPLKRKRSKR